MSEHEKHNEEAELASEQERVTWIIGLLEAEIQRLTPEVGELHSQVVDIRKNFWEDVTLNLSNSDDAMESVAAMRQQAEVLTEREISHGYRVSQLKSMKRLLNAPYFGRIDFQENGLPASEPFYIGLSSFHDAASGEFYIYDWRTPVASLYYDYPPGPAQYATPSGTIEGELDLKRQFIIQAGQIEAMFNTGVTIGDELLQRALGRHSDSQMKSIVATIQKDQNRIIRNVTSRMLIVQGAAGSGKTSAALQRVAYLLYRFRGSLTADQIVLFSPNPLFNSYVASVLPELGETNMQQTTFHEFLEHSLGASLPLESPFAQMEYVLTAAGTPGYTDRIEGIRYKASEGFLHVIQNYKERLEREGMLFSDLLFRERVLFSAEQLKEQFYSYDSSIRLANRMDLLKDWLLKQLSRLEVAERQAPWVEDELNYLDKEQYQQAYQKVRKQQQEDNRDREESYLEEGILRQMVVKEHFKPLRMHVRKLKFTDIPALYSRLFVDQALMQQLVEASGHRAAKLPANWPAICELTLAKLAKGELYGEDATPFLYLKELVEGFQTNTQIRHVLLDEGQDYSAFQFAFLKRLFPHAKMTVLGDFNQAIFTHSTALTGETPIAELYGEEATERIELTQSYRSTWEIVMFTRALLAGDNNILPFSRHGSKPQLIQVRNGEEQLEQLVHVLHELHSQGYETIGVIGKTAAESREAFDRLAEVSGLEGVRLIAEDTPSFEKGISIIPSYLAKGVEFDAVLVLDASAERYAHEHERKLFYTACTRAMHTLMLLYKGEATPFLSHVDPERYEHRSLTR